MNKKMIFSTLGKLTISEAILMIFPLIVALIYEERQSAIAFLISIGIAAVIGLALYFPPRGAVYSLLKTPCRRYGRERRVD